MENALARLQQHGTRVCQANRSTGRPLEQARADGRLQEPDLLGDGWLGEEQNPRRPRKAPLSGRGHEYL